MGKPFQNELKCVPETYKWALEQSIDAFQGFVHGSLGCPLYVVASGGAYTAATYAARLHESLTGKPAQAITPLEYGSLLRLDGSVLFLSAGGMNGDITSAFRRAVLNEPERIGVICFKEGSRLATLAKSVSTDLFAKEIPTGGDGFLATNSLIAFFVLLFRSYASIFALPKLNKKLDISNTVSVSSREDIASVVSKPHLVT